MISGGLIQQCIITLIELFFTHATLIEAQRSLSLKFLCFTLHSYGLYITQILCIVGVFGLFLIQRNSESLYRILRGATVDMNTGDLWRASGSSIMSYF